MRRLFEIEIFVACLDQKYIRDFFELFSTIVDVILTNGKVGHNVLKQFLLLLRIEEGFFVVL